MAIRRKSKAEIEKAKQGVRAQMKDPASVQFRNVRGYNKGGMALLCGEVNAKNSFGAYTGFRRFIAGSKELVIVEGVEGLSSSEFAQLWAKTCGTSPTGAQRG